MHRNDLSALSALPALAARAALAALVVVFAFAPALYAVGEGRVLGTVNDPDGKPLADVSILITSPEFKYEQKKSSDKKGKFSLLVLDATRTYTIRLEREGYQPLEEPLEPRLGETLRMTYVLAPVVVAAPAGPAEAEGTGQAVTLYNEGVVAYNGGDLATAATKFEEAAKLDPNLLAAPLTLSGLYLDRKQYAEAAAASEQVLAIEPGNETALRNRYDAYHEGGMKEKATAALEDFVVAAPGREAAVRVFNLGAAASRADDNDAALAHLRRAVELDPSLEQGYSALEGIYLSKKQYKEAVEVAERHLAANPNSLEAMTVRAEAYRALGDKTKAAEAQQAMEAAQTTMSAADFYRQGVALYNANNVAGARAAFERALAKDAAHPKSHYMLGLVFISTGDNAKAKEYLERFIALAPEDNDAATAKEMLASLK